VSSKGEQTLAARRLELVERSAVQRGALLATTRPLLRKAEALDKVVATVRRYPLVMAIGATAFALLGPRRLLDLGIRGVALYQLLKR
jgi:hypothetical protein